MSTSHEPKEQKSSAHGHIARVTQPGELGPIYAPDEIDLVDLGVLLWRWRWLMFAVFMVFIILTIIGTVLKTPTYEYTTTLQLGTIIQTNGNLAPLMSAQLVAQALEDAYLPAARGQYVSENHLGSLDAVGIPKVVATAKSDSSDVVLSCKTKLSSASKCIAIEKIAAGNFVKNNSRFAAAAQNKLASLQSQAKVLQVQMNKLDASATLYKQQAKDLEQQIARMQKAALGAARRADSGSAALSNLILNTEVQRAMDSLSTVRQNLDVTIPQQRAQLNHQVSDNRRAQQLQEQDISQGYMQVLNAGLRSPNPVGLGQTAVFGVGFILSIILALIAAFIATYVSNVYARLTTRSDS